MRFAVFQYPLDNPAAIRMSGEDMDLTSECLDDELDMFSWDSLNGFLNNVVAILVFDAFQNICLKLIDKIRLLVCKNVLQRLKNVVSLSLKMGSSN